MNMVEWKKLGDIAKRNKGIPITAGQMSELNTSNGNVRVFAAGQTLADINENDLPENCAHLKPSIIVKSRGYIDFVFYEKPFTHKNEMWSYSFDDREEGKFLYYYLTTKTEFFRKKAKANSVKLPQLCVADTDDYLVPYPSLQEQKRIVGILDTFTASIDNLKEQIAQRRKQFEYYRDQLLDLEGKEGVEMKKLGEVCDIKGRIGFRGYTREDQVGKGEGALTLTATNIVNQHINYQNNTYITWEKYYESPEIMVNEEDIIVCQRGSIGKIAMVVNLKEKATINPQLLLLKNIKCNNRFLIHYLLCRFFQEALNKIIGHGTVQMIAQKDLKELQIPLITNSREQQRIVSILDTFEASIQNLEAQLSQREKQYEYYRNKLLTFD